MDGARSMRAGKDSLAVPPEGKVGKIGRPSPGFMARLGVPVGWAGENGARSGGLIRVILERTYTSKRGKPVESSLQAA